VERKDEAEFNLVSRHLSGKTELNHVESQLVTVYTTDIRKMYIPNTNQKYSHLTKFGRRVLFKATGICVTSCFRRDVNEDCALLGCYAARIGNSLPTFRYKLSVPSSGVKIPKLLDLDFGFLTPEDGTDRLYRNVAKELPLRAA